MIELMERYKVHNLDYLTPEAFEKIIRDMIDQEDWEIEGYASPAGQRMPSMKFYWGHNHDFGTFKLEGRMKNRHIEILKWYADHGMPTDLRNKRVLDIGCWTGGMSLLLYAMGEPHIDVLEEVVKYASAINFMALAFKLKNMNVWSESLYDFETKNKYDLINFSGVLYHITDIPVALAIIAKHLKIGGMLCLESGCMPGELKVLHYAGPSKNQDFNWNWFFPTVSCLTQMLLDVGIIIDDLEVGPLGHRVKLIATKVDDKPMMQCGVSIRI